MSEEDFTRLYKGKLANVLDFIAQSVQGRARVAAARGEVQREREGIVRNHQTNDPLHAAARRADSRLKNARISLEEMQKSHSEQKKNIEMLGEISNHVPILETHLKAVEHEELRLRASLEQKIRTSLLLDILERKENIRSQRFSEISQLLTDLREKEMAEETASVASSSISFGLTKVPRTENTSDVLSTLQSHAVRISQLEKASRLSKGPTSMIEAETQMLDAVAHSLDLPPDDPRVEDAL
ncbi:uncharacterized protein BXZ73DRAFT_78578 [Epithele typhae]|uniref:uncharacterized protein n=1 Tax=Epithele typhae TaxID=378194 RepID=UPI002008D8E6|nr:uncharacterized protein BXZ73DRAFT_78578 [Epithele typhae]KAH9927094.1 hypothetical protein BXZ73DRAFT_78578 [Epithele typhae]